MTVENELTIEKIEQVLDRRTEQIIEELDKRFDSNNAKLINYIDKRFDQVGEDIDYLKVEIRDLKGRVIHLEDSMEEVQESLKNLENAESKDAIASINHEHRIRNLEKITGTKGVSSTHLAEI